MARKYRQFSVEERCEIARLSAAGTSARQIAAALDRTASSIGRELKRNRGADGVYRPGYAQEQARARDDGGIVMPVTRCDPGIQQRPSGETGSRVKSEDDD